jgi:hypothetical protein
MANEQLTVTSPNGDAAAWNLPDSDISVAAYRLAQNVSDPAIHNHCVRSYLFGRELAAAQGLRAGTDYDDETVFLGCILHDLGLTSYGMGDQRFEVEGADAAARFLREHGFPEECINVVWQTIALHSSVGLGHRFGPNHAVAHGGISLDIVGMQKEALPSGFADRVHAAWPRHNAAYALADRIARDTQANPLKAPPFSLPAHIHTLLNHAPLPSFADLATIAGWGDEIPPAPGG